VTFTATVTDVYGNGVPGVSVTFTQHGPGSIPGGTSSTQTTDSQGRVTVKLSTVSSDNGSGTMAAAINAPQTTQCQQAAGQGLNAAPTTPAGNCSTQTTYKVNATNANSLSLAAANGQVNKPETVTATAKDGSGAPAAGVIVRFTISGANTASGTGTTNNNGVATFQYTPSKTGRDTATAFADTNNNSTKDTGEPSATTSYSITAGASSPSEPGYRTGSTSVLGDQNGQAIGSVRFGNSGDITLWGDWNGDGTATIGVFRPSTHTFYLSDDNKTASITKSLGNRGDLPITGDFNGDGIDSIGVYRPTGSTFYLTNDDANVTLSVHFGNSGDRPIIGDWDGTGTSQIGVYRPSNATFYRAGQFAVHFGNKGDTPIVGDWDADGVTTIGVIRDQTWYLSNNNSSAATSFTFGTSGSRHFTYATSAGSSAPTSS
jgi:hypothetical protein